jgi:DNA ligase-1
MFLPTLYARTSNGSVQQWSIEVIENTFRTHEGLKDGKITISLPTVCEAKNVGRANETTPEDQAKAEAQSKWQKKIDSGYYEDISQIDVEKFTEPMLAKKYDDEFEKSMFPVYSQPKLDGMRCVARKDGLWSRNGKKIVSVPHIEKQLANFFKTNPNAILDGELYCDKFANDFNAIISLVKKTKPKQEDIDASAKVIQYWVYDTISKEKFSKRFYDVWGTLKSIVDTKVIVQVPTTLVETQEKLDELNGQYVSGGYEGQMVRIDKGYEQKRSKFLLKRKEFDDTEYEIIDIFEGDGNRSGMAGYATIKLADGRTCKSNIKGNQVWLKELLESAKKVKGKMATVRHFKLTPDGIPRFPYVITIRDYE